MAFTSRKTIIAPLPQIGFGKSKRTLCAFRLDRNYDHGHKVFRPSGADSGYQNRVGVGDLRALLDVHVHRSIDCFGAHGRTIETVRSVHPETIRGPWKQDLMHAGIHRSGDCPVAKDSGVVSHDFNSAPTNRLGDAGNPLITVMLRSTVWP